MPISAARSGRAIRVLVVMSDAPLANLVVFTLRHGTYEQRIAATVAAAQSALEEWKPDLLLVDIDLENGRAAGLIDGRNAEGRMAVIALTRRNDLRGKLDAFERGVDDYIGLPFVPDDLVARAHAVLRRTFGDGGRLIPTLRIGDLQIDVLNRRVTAGEHQLHLTSLEQALLYLLAANAGTILSRDQIMNALWGSDFVSESNIVDRHVRALRAKLQDDWHQPRYIETISGEGYRFIPLSSPPAHLNVGPQ